MDGWIGSPWPHFVTLPAALARHSTPGPPTFCLVCSGLLSMCLPDASAKGHATSCQCATVF